MKGITAEAKDYLKKHIQKKVAYLSEMDKINAVIDEIPLVREEELLYTTEQVADETGLSPMTIKTFPHKLGVGEKIGRDWFFTFSDIETIKNRDGKRK